MVNVFGDERELAIHAAVDPGLEPPSAVWGSMCVSCRGVQLGDLDETGCALYPAYVAFRDLAGRLDELWDPELDGHDDAAIWNLLHRRLYGEGALGAQLQVPAIVRAQLDGVVDLEVTRDWERFSKLEFLTNWGEQFDGSPAFILCPPAGGVRILSPALEGGRVELSKASVIAAATQFVRWFEAEQQRLAG